jgi:hypothetical protein
MSIIIYHFEFQLPICSLSPKFLNFLKSDCGTIPVAKIISDKIEIFSKHQRFLIATESSKYLLIFVYMSVLNCVNLEQLYLKDMLAFVVYL